MTEQRQERASATETGGQDNLETVTFKKYGLFQTPKNSKELQAFIEAQPADEKRIAYIAWMMCLNLIARDLATIDQIQVKDDNDDVVATFVRKTNIQYEGEPDYLDVIGMMLQQFKGELKLAEIGETALLDEMGLVLKTTEGKKYLVTIAEMDH